MPDTFTVTEDPATWRDLIEAAAAAGADVEMSDATLAILRAFPPPSAAPGAIGVIGPPLGRPAVYVTPDLPDGLARLRHRPTFEEALAQAGREEER